MKHKTKLRIVRVIEFFEGVGTVTRAALTIAAALGGIALGAVIGLSLSNSFIGAASGAAIALIIISQ